MSTDVTMHYEGEGMNPVFDNLALEQEWSNALLERQGLWHRESTTRDGDDIVITAANGQATFRITGEGDGPTPSTKTRLVKFDADTCLPWQTERPDWAKAAVERTVYTRANGWNEEVLAEVGGKAVDGHAVEA